MHIELVENYSNKMTNIELLNVQHRALLHDNKTHIVYGYTTHQTMALYTANNASLYRTKWASLHHDL